MTIKRKGAKRGMTVEEAEALFRKGFRSPELSVTESYHTYFDTLEGHWNWWVRIEGQLVDIPETERAECDQAVKAAIATLATAEGIPYTIHLLHVQLRNRWQ